MEFQGRCNQHNIYLGDDTDTSVIPILRQTRMISRERLRFYGKPETPEQEEAGLSEQNPNLSSAMFERNRVCVRDALRAIVSFVFDKYNLPKKNGIDFGSGATGEMVEELLPPACDKSKWSQVDVNPAAVAENRRRHPQSVIVQGSYLNTGKTLGLHDHFDIATGLSSLDATQFLARAITEIREVLKVGGYLLHVQDVRPGLGCGLAGMMQMGYEPPYDAETIVGRNYGGKPEPLVMFAPNGQEFSVGELFRGNLNRTIEQTPGMQLLCNDWIIARRNLPTGEMERLYYLNILLRTNRHPPIEEASAIVTVARKI